jgi:hypothetical protein
MSFSNPESPVLTQIMPAILNFSLHISQPNFLTPPLLHSPLSSSKLPTALLHKPSPPHGSHRNSHHAPSRILSNIWPAHAFTRPSLKRNQNQNPLNSKNRPAALNPNRRPNWVPRTRSELVRANRTPSFEGSERGAGAGMSRRYGCPVQRPVCG